MVNDDTKRKRHGHYERPCRKWILKTMSVFTKQPRMRPQS
jgi:hypothetical protein